MRMERVQHYPVPMARLLEALTSAACYAARYHLPSTDKSAFEVWEQSDAGLRIRACKQVPMKTDKLPRLLRPFIAEQMPLHLEFFWRDYQPGWQPRQAFADVQLSLGKLPLEVKGLATIAAVDAESSVQMLQLELISHLPLFGKSVLERAEKKVDDLLQEDRHTLLDYLAATA